MKKYLVLLFIILLVGCNKKEVVEDKEVISFKGRLVCGYKENRVNENVIYSSYYTFNFNDNGILEGANDVEMVEFNGTLDSIKDKDKPLIVMLDHLEDPHNFGAIIRTSEAMGVDAIIIPSDRSVKVNSTVIKTSVGSINYMKIIRVPNLQVAIKKLKDNNFWIIGTDMDGADYTKIDYNMPICLIIGNEGKGISNVIRKNCDYIASIPMIGKINSLNASVSCGIIISRIVSSRG